MKPITNVVLLYSQAKQKVQLKALAKQTIQANHQIFPDFNTHSVRFVAVVDVVVIASAVDVVVVVVVAVVVIIVVAAVIVVVAFCAVVVLVSASSIFELVELV